MRNALAGRIDYEARLLELDSDRLEAHELDVQVRVSVCRRCSVRAAACPSLLKCAGWCFVAEFELCVFVWGWGWGWGRRGQVSACQLRKQYEEEAKVKGGAMALNAVNNWLTGAANASAGLLTGAGVDGPRSSSTKSNSSTKPAEATASHAVEVLVDEKADDLYCTVLLDSAKVASQGQKAAAFGLRLKSQGRLADGLFAKPEREHAFAVITSSMARPRPHYACVFFVCPINRQPPGRRTRP